MLRDLIAEWFRGDDVAEPDIDAEAEAFYAVECRERRHWSLDEIREAMADYLEEQEQ